MMMSFLLLAGHEARRVQALQEEDEEDEQTDGGRAQTGSAPATPLTHTGSDQRNVFVF